MAGEASEALARRARTPSIPLGDTSVPGDRGHPGRSVGRWGAEWVRTPPVRLRRGHFAANRPFRMQRSLAQEP